MLLVHWIHFIGSKGSEGFLGASVHYCFGHDELVETLVWQTDTLTPPYTSPHPPLSK